MSASSPFTISALTVYQPWATLIAEQLKPFEFRSRKAPDWLIDRPLAIHAAKRAPVIEEMEDLVEKLEYGGDIARSTGLTEHEQCLSLLRQWILAPGLLPLSSILCVVTVGRPLANKELCEKLGVKYVNDSDRDEHSNWGWPLSNVTRLSPFVPIGGQRGLWKWQAPGPVL